MAKLKSDAQPATVTATWKRRIAATFAGLTRRAPGMGSKNTVPLPTGTQIRK